MLCRSFGISEEGSIDVMGRHETAEKESEARPRTDAEIVGQTTGCMLG